MLAAQSVSGSSEWQPRTDARTSHTKQCLLKTLGHNQDKPVPDLLNATFHNVDKELASLASEKGSSSGCTAAVAFLRLEDESGRPLNASNEASKEAADNSGKATSQQGQDGAANDGLWGKVSKSFSSADNKSKDGSAPSSRRVLYTANVGDARAVLW